MKKSFARFLRKTSRRLDIVCYVLEAFANDLDPYKVPPVPAGLKVKFMSMTDFDDMFGDRLEEHLAKDPSLKKPAVN